MLVFSQGPDYGEIRLSGVNEFTESPFTWSEVDPNTAMILTNELNIDFSLRVKFHR